MNNQSTTVIVGGGAVAHHLGVAFRDSADVVLINPRTLEGLPEKADIYIIAVKDDAIPEVAQNMAERNITGTVVHTSGSTPINSLDCLKGSCRTGVMYPLQTFSPGIVIDYSQIPFFIESDDDSTAETIRHICAEISVNVFEANSELRSKLHLAAVFASNFTNALIVAADKTMSDTPFDYKVLMPLIKETLRKIEHKSPYLTQTGPAVRKDMSTICKQRQKLEFNKGLLNIYDAMTDYIMNQLAKN